MPRRSPRNYAAALLLVSALLGAAIPAATSAATNTLYVDGKTGSDSNGGRSSTDAFKTIAKAAAALPAGSGAAGWTVSVKGYTDYVYRERPIPMGWDRRGTSSAKVTFQAAGYVAGASSGYVKPIVSGADVVPKGTWKASSKSGVWYAPWATTPFDYGKFSGSIKTALFQNAKTWLWEQTSLDALAKAATAGKGGYWYDKSLKRIYASAVGSSKNPANYEMDVIVRASFYFMGTNGVSNVAVRGFEVRNSANGIALAKGVDGSTVADNVVTGNLMMGIATSGAQTSSGSNPATGNTIARNRGSANTFQLIKIGEGSTSTTVCDNEAWGNGMQGIKVTGPASGSSYKGSTTGITVCRNKLHDNHYNPTGSVYNNAPGLLITNGAKNVTVDNNLIYGNNVGIHISQESSGRAVMDGIALKHNQIHDNRRFGINFFDGAYGSSTGAGRMRSDYDLIWGNGIGIQVSRASTNKTIAHATVHGNDAEGIKVGEANVTGSKATISASLVTNNGGYGLWLVTGSNASVSYTGFSGNILGSIKGSPSKVAVNTKPAGYLSTSPTNSAYLRISSSSYQYTAGSGGSPIGARY
jgi:Right handed beta helix region